MIKPRQLEQHRKILGLDEGFSLSPDELRQARVALGLSTACLATVLQIAQSRTIQRWESGDVAIPGPAIVLIRLLLEIEEARRMVGVADCPATQS